MNYFDLLGAFSIVVFILMFPIGYIIEKIQSWRRR